ncbi:laccase [Delphinella strobiligena]|nr:laccase [Delphinella strobiligena]
MQASVYRRKIQDTLYEMIEHFSDIRHVDFCYPDGYRQALIVHDADAWFANEYAEEFAVTISDWYHEINQDIQTHFISEYNSTGAEPIPKSFLFNDTLDTSIPVQPNATYLLRIINTGAFVAKYFYIEDHNFTIIEVDGVCNEPQEADSLYIAVAQRYSILITTKDAADKNYAIVTVADQVLLEVVLVNLQLNLTNWLEYDAPAAHEQAVVTLDVVDSNPAYDDFDLVPYDKTLLFANPDRVINLTVTMGILGNGKPYASFNDISYTTPKVPALYSALSAGDQAVRVKFMAATPMHLYLINSTLLR